MAATNRPRWMEQYDKCIETLQKIQRLEEIRSDENIKHNSETTTKMFHICNLQIRRIKELAPPNDSAATLAMQKLTCDLQAQYRSLRAFVVQISESDPEESMTFRESSRVEFDQQQTQDLELQQHLVKERHQEILRVSRNVEALGQLFQQLDILVSNQGDVIDRIDVNVEKVVNHVTEANQELAVAERCGENNRKTKCCLIVAILVVIAVVFTYIWFKVHQN